MVFPHQITLLNQFFITLPAACLLSIAIHANSEYRRGFQLNKGEITADIVCGALVWLPCRGLLKLIAWIWGEGWFNITIFYLFYGSLAISVFVALKKALIYHNTVGEFVHWCKNLGRPSWDKLPCKFKGRGMAGIGKDYAEDKARWEKVFKINQAAVDRVTNDKILLKIATQATDYEIREYALLKMKDQTLVKQALKKKDYSQSVLLRLAGVGTLEEAIERAGDVELLLQIIRYCGNESDIGQAFAKLPEDFDFSAIVCDTGYTSAIRLKALDRCNNAQTIRRIFLKLNTSERSRFDEIRIKVAEKCNDPGFINEIIPQLLGDFSNENLSRIIRKCSDKAILKQIAAGDFFSNDTNRIEAIQAISDQEYLLEVALKSRKEDVAKAALKKINPETIEKYWPRILVELDFMLLYPLLNKNNSCPECGGELCTNSSSSTRTVGAPGDSFFRTTEWYEATTSYSAIKCKGCQKIWRTYFSED